MKKTTIAMIALMLTTMTACEKASMDEDSGSGQGANSLLQVRTRGGGGGSEATVSYPVQDYPLHGQPFR